MLNGCTCAQKKKTTMEKVWVTNLLISTWFALNAVSGAGTAKEGTGDVCEQMLTLEKLKMGSNQNAQLNKKIFLCPRG